MSLCGKDLGRQFPGWVDEGGIELCALPFDHELPRGPHDDERRTSPVCRGLPHEEYVPEDRRPLIVGLLKVRNELVRDSNLYRCLDNLMEFCDTLVVCDDASTDGTDLVIRDFFAKHNIPLTQLLIIKPEEQDFRKELAVKQRMLERIHRMRPHWIWWHDGDEVLPHPTELRAWLEEMKRDDDPRRPVVGAYRLPYVQLWREGMWARTDSGFADGRFVKLWHWHPELRFDVVHRTHHMQFPINVGSIGDIETPVIHFGNWGKNLQWKCIQYWGGLGGVERHMNFEEAEYQLLDYDWSNYPLLATTQLSPMKYLPPRPFTEREKKMILEMQNLRGLKEWFTVVIPTYNRADYLTRTITSLKRQRYEKWIALVLDDGSTDRTPELMRRIALHDPRVFYARHPKRGAVAMNEIGMRFACEATEWWTRLGSDDYFEPNKLLLDAMALRRGEWCYGPFRVLRDQFAGVTAVEPDWQLAELCNRPEQPKTIVDGLLAGRFFVSWANIAARTSLLRKVYERHGNFCPPELINMEDFVVNARMARFAPPVFRAQFVSGGSIWYDVDHAIVNQEQLAHDAIWRVNPIGATASTKTTSRDDELSREIIAKENELYAP